MTGRLSESEQTAPGFEFEGPIGRFWTLEEVPIESITTAIAECLNELYKRGVSGDEAAERVLAVTKERTEWLS